MRCVRSAALCGLASAAVLDSGALAEEDNATTQDYVAPSAEGLHCAETFDGDVWSRWTPSASDKYNGKFTVERRSQEALVGDVGLLVPEEAKHYGISNTFSPIVGRKEMPFVVQYEVKLQDGLTCGGAYLKLFDSTVAAGGFKDDTPYVIMFGPDRCGGTDKVHFILRHRSPKTGEWEEKHFKDAPGVPQDRLSHLYGLVVRPDNTFEIQIDGEKKASGSLLSSMSPAINPPKDIDDPADSKPEDWVDEAKMDDPSSSKPDEWDEDAPMMLDDPSASKPDGWEDEQENKIPDPSAEKPEDWDDDEDGEWEAPIVDNPACKVGCGEWKPPRVNNPEYKGKWHAPKIDNPDYKGVWGPRQIPNPDYFLDDSPSVLPQIDSIGIDLWTMTKGMMFDNIVVSDDVEKVKAFTDATFRPRKELEDKQQPTASTSSSTEFLSKALEFVQQNMTLEFVQQNMIAVAVAVGVLFAASFWCLCCAGGDGGLPAETQEEKTARRAKRRAEQEAQKQAKEAEGEKAGEKEGDASPKKEAEATEEKKDESGKPRQRRPKQKEEGGLGDLAAEDE